jgi:RNA polymerase sigma-70 factor (ECF subfamily)
MGDSMQALYEQGQRQWPGVSLTRERFTDHVMRVVGSNAELDGLHGDGLYLAAACVAGDEAAIMAFRQAHADDVTAVVHRMGLAEHKDEITQSLLRQLFAPDTDREPFIANYAGRGALGSWLRVVAVREAYRIVRELRKRGKREVLSDHLLAERAVDDRDPELNHLKGKYKRAFREAFQAAFEALSRRDRQLLRYCYLDGLNLDQVATIYNVSRATAGRWRLTAQQAILDQTRARMEESLRMDKSEFESIMRVVRSELDLSIMRLLQSRSSNSE